MFSTLIEMLHELWIWNNQSPIDLLACFFFRVLSSFAFESKNDSTANETIRRLLMQRWWDSIKQDSTRCLDCDADILVFFLCFQTIEHCFLVIKKGVNCIGTTVQTVANYHIHVNYSKTAAFCVWSAMLPWNLFQFCSDDATEFLVTQ